jgi:hypothetical protein
MIIVNLKVRLLSGIKHKRSRLIVDNKGAFTGSAAFKRPPAEREKRIWIYLEGRILPSGVLGTLLEWDIFFLSEGARLAVEPFFSFCGAWRPEAFPGPARALLLRAGGL